MYVYRHNIPSPHRSFWLVGEVVVDKYRLVLGEGLGKFSDLPQVFLFIGNDNDNVPRGPSGDEGRPLRCLSLGGCRRSGVCPYGYSSVEVDVNMMDDGPQLSRTMMDDGPQPPRTGIKTFENRERLIMIIPHATYVPITHHQYNG